MTKDPISLPLQIKLGDAHTIHNLNIISSTKIHQKVTQILRLFDILPAPAPTVTEPKTNDTNAPSAKKGILIRIQARANVASKLISIVEIVKRDLARREKERTSSRAEKDGSAKEEGGMRLKLYQYTTITTIRVEVKPKQKLQASNPLAKSKPEATTLSHPQEPQKLPQQTSSKADPGAAEESVTANATAKRKRVVDGSSQDAVPAKRTKTGMTEEEEEEGEEEEEQGKEDEEEEDKPANANEAHDDNDDNDNDNGKDDNDDDDDVFEEMKPRPAGISTEGVSAAPEETVGVENVIKQERDVPVLIIYLSMSPVPELRELYGEQSS